ncbi:hypothetical protein Ciccas_006689 [Cichlidogyrus casuarinus]|uniref:Cas1p 10 TM acyl transferase domain-containing protein n=1 Tax=Cichlidogyrus casuarinus TaxID=1844966 RepID=A0ABD2Q522_9PLAT
MTFRSLIINAITDSLLFQNLQILLNRFCNDHMRFFDGTCCTKPESISIVQFWIFGLFLVAFAISLILRLLAYFTKTLHYFAGAATDQQTCSLLWHSSDFFFCIARLGLIMVYFFVSDRTIFFMKAGKFYSITSIVLPIVYFSVVGFFFTKRLCQDKALVLNVDQTLECKGWLQLLILVYHISGASQLMPVYLLMRCVVSCYLFLSAYGHFMHYCNAKNGSNIWQNLSAIITRYLNVMFRMNFLVLCLCLVMNRPYQFYYFVPLISFCYTSQMLLMYTGPSLVANRPQPRLFNRHKKAISYGGTGKETTGK